MLNRIKSEISAQGKKDSLAEAVRFMAMTRQQDREAALTCGCPKPHPTRQYFGRWLCLCGRTIES